MPRIAAMCDHCGAIFPSGIEIANAANVTLQNNKQTCPRCGLWADQGKVDEAFHNLELMQAELAKLADKNAELQQLVTENVLRSEADASNRETSRVPAAARECAPRNEEMWDQKGYVEDDDDDGG